jgi:8-oxo-dGTP pyrophosphatase MutT (NUDIX family)
MNANCDCDLAEIKEKVAKYSWNTQNLRKNMFSDESLHNSAVLVPLVIQNDQLSLLFTHRSNSLERHSGQVSFPGGIIEKGDKSIVDTALRETREEIGISGENIEVFGQLVPFNTSTGYFVYPVVGIIDSLKNINRNIVEVDRIFCIPLSWLCTPEHSRLEEFISPDGKARNVWYFDPYDGELLWGITAKITHDLLELIKK